MVSSEVSTSQLLHSIRPQGLLSFDETGVDLELRPLNVLIGPNASGKSNLIEIVSLLRAAPTDFASAIRESGGITDWLWKGAPGGQASIAVTVCTDGKAAEKLGYDLTFGESSQRFDLRSERIWHANGAVAPPANRHAAYLYILEQDVHLLCVNGEIRYVAGRDIDRQRSILAQRKDPERFPEITRLAELLGQIRIYRDWSFGRRAPAREPQKSDMRNDFLDEDCGNLGLVLNRLRRVPVVKEAILEHLKALYPSVTDFDVIVEAGTVQVFLQEGRVSIPATRLSDGTLRYLCLLAILCHPSPPPLVCIEEPELGLHPDALVNLGTLLKEASSRTQLIVTTHSNILIDSLSSEPEDVIVCEKPEDATQMRRLDGDLLRDWLERYSLGELWRRGEIGGNRW